MKRMLFNATYAEELRVATVDGQKLINFDIETSSKEQRRGNVYKGVVTRIEASLEACFVDYGTDKQGFLPFKEIDYRYLSESTGQRIKDFSKIPVGTEIIVQVDKDERGNKGAALTSYITLPGRYLVLMPNNARSGGISRRIEGEERDELKSLMSKLDIPNGMSIILRTAALGRVIEELEWDLIYLLKLWDAIKVASHEQKGAFLIYQESSLVIRSIRDHFVPDVAEILIDTEEIFNQAHQFMLHVMPHYADRVKFYRDDIPLFSRFQIEHQIESAYSRTVNLPLGGAIVIDHTEALTSVDVNSAKANKGSDIEATALATNLEASEEIARQLRLRDLGGLVVVDFIDMENPKNQRDLELYFKAQLSLDRARIQMGKLSKFGLLELSRQRLQSSLDESSTITCPRCSGVGSIRGIESSAIHVLRIIQEEAVKNSNHLSALHVQLPVDVATYLLNERREDVHKIEQRMRVKVILVPNIHLETPNYKIRKLSYDYYDSNFNKSSYDLVEVPMEQLNYKVGKKSDLEVSATPVVQNIASNSPAPMIMRKTWWARIVDKVKIIFKQAGKLENHEAKKSLPVDKAKIDKSRKFDRRNQGINEKENKNINLVKRNTNLKNTVSSRTENPGVKPQMVAQANSNEAVLNNSRLERNKTNLKNANLRNSREPNIKKTASSVNVGLKDNSQNLNPTKQPANLVRKQVEKPLKSEKFVMDQPAKVLMPKFEVLEDKINIANNTAGKYNIFASSQSGTTFGVIINQEATSTVEKSQALNSNQKIKSAVSASLDLNLIDLGELKLIATKAELLNLPAEEVNLTVKRYLDLDLPIKSLPTDTEYELVETKQ